MTFPGVIWEGGIWREHEGEWGKGFPRPVKATSRGVEGAVTQESRLLVLLLS